MALTTNLEAYWKLDGNSNDATANGHNGTDTSISYSTTNAVINQAAQFGATSGILIPDAAGFDGTSAITLNAWFYATGANLNGPLTLIGKSDATAAGGTYLRIDITSSKAQGTPDGDLHQINGNTTLSINTRYMVTMTYDGTTCSLYVNGSKDVSDMTFSHAVTPGTGHVGIGILGDFSGHQYFASGAIDEVGFWSRAITSGEVTSLYNSGNGFAYPFVSATTSLPFKSLLGVGI